MKRIIHILNLFAVLTMMVACSQPVKVEVLEVSVEGPSLELSAIDSLMWQHADNALAVMMEFAASPEADSLDAFNGHYCQLLISELLYKNYYGQSNRAELLQAVSYFDSLCCRDVARRVSTTNPMITFLSARAHYIDGAGYYERDSVVAACSEYLKALEIMETHFPDVETCHGASIQPNHIPRFMSLIYGRLAELFSGQFMQEPAIVCCKKALAFNSIEQGSPNNQSSLLAILGNQYHKLKQYDSAEYYYNESLRRLSNTENLVYRDLVSQMALLHYEIGKGVEPSISDLKRMATQVGDDRERLVRYLTIGAIYYEDKQYDSALAYLIPVFENDGFNGQKIAASEIRDIYQYLGDTLKATQFAIYLAENTTLEGESNAQVSQLNELFQQHSHWKREKAEAERRQAEQEAARLRSIRSIVAMTVVLLVAGLGLCWLARRRKEHNAETQAWHEEKQQLQTQVDEITKQARAMLPQRAKDLYHSNVPNRLERIMAEFEAAYPKVTERLSATHPDLSETERQIAVLNFLHFRAKEEAELTGFAENTILKYRSNLHKKVGSDPISVLIAEERI